MAHYHHRDEAAEAFDAAEELADPAERLESLAVAQYHALLAIYELTLDTYSRLEALHIGVLSVADALGELLKRKG